MGTCREAVEGPGGLGKDRTRLPRRYRSSQRRNGRATNGGRGGRAGGGLPNGAAGLHGGQDCSGEGGSAKVGDVAGQAAAPVRTFAVGAGEVHGADFASQIVRLDQGKQGRGGGYEGVDGGSDCG